MSRMRKEEVTCPECGNTQKAEIWGSINVDADPDLRERLFEGKINMLTCESCGFEAFFNAPLLYHDMSRRYCIYYFPAQTLDGPNSLEEFAADGTIKSDFDQYGAGYLAAPHVVFDMGEMLRYILFREFLHDRDVSSDE